MSVLACHSADKNKNIPAPVNASTPALQQHDFIPLFQYGDHQLFIYDQYLANLDSEKVQMGQVALRKFHELFDGHQPEICDTAFYIFNRFHQRLTFALQEDRAHDSVNQDTLYLLLRTDKKPVVSKKIAVYAKALDSSGFTMEEDEGNAYIHESWLFMDRNFSAYVTPGMKAFLGQLNKEQKEGFQDDAALEISPVQLADRTVWWEQFAKSHQRFIYSGDAGSFHAFFVKILLEGTDNTPVSWEDSLTPFYREAYSYIGSHFAGSRTNKVIAPYFKAWETRDTAEINQIIRSLDSSPDWPSPPLSPGS